MPCHFLLQGKAGFLRLAANFGEPIPSFRAKYSDMNATNPGGGNQPSNDDQRMDLRPRGDSSRPVTPESLAGLEFFRGLRAKHMAEIARYSKRCHFETGDTLSRQGELANCFYVLTSGRVVIEFSSGGQRVSVEEVGAGDAVGFSWLFDPQNVHFTTRALEPVDAIFFYGTLVREDCEIDHELGYELTRRMSQVMLKRLEAIAQLLAQTLTKGAASPR